MSAAAAARMLGISRQIFHDILAERKPLSGAMCLKIARLFGSTPQFWMRLQADYDLKKAARRYIRPSITAESKKSDGRE